MIRFLARRLVQGAVIVLLVSFTIFALLRLIPGDPARMILGPVAPDAATGPPAPGPPAPGPPAPGPAAPGLPAPGPPAPSDVTAAERERLAREALEVYRRARQRLAAGDFRGYGEEFERLGRILERLAGTR